MAAIENQCTLETNGFKCTVLAINFCSTTLHLRSVKQEFNFVYDFVVRKSGRFQLSTSMFAILPRGELPH